MPRVNDASRAAPMYMFLVEVGVTLGGVNTDWHGMRRACGDAVAGRWRLNVRHIRPATCARGTGTKNGDRAIARERCRTSLISVKR